MGGDGGVIASDRRYMRGAGSATHTGDSLRPSASSKAEAEKNSQLQVMSTCAITGSPINYRTTRIVACPLGRLYGHEAAVKALLRRLGDGRDNNSLVVRGEAYQTSSSSSNGDLGYYIRGLKDLHTVRFQLSTKVGKNDEKIDVPICPVTSVELNGVQPAFLIVKIKKKKNKRKERDQMSKDEKEMIEGPNVLSDKAIRELGFDSLQEEYGPFHKDDLIRLAPPHKMIKEINLKLDEKRLFEQSIKTKKKKRKAAPNSKNNRLICDDVSSKLSKGQTNNARKFTTVNDVRTNVAAAVTKNPVLSTLFTNSQSGLSEKVKKDNLFANNC